MSTSERCCILKNKFPRLFPRSLLHGVAAGRGYSGERAGAVARLPPPVSRLRSGSTLLTKGFRRLGGGSLAWGCRRRRGSRSRYVNPTRRRPRLPPPSARRRRLRRRRRQRLRRHGSTARELHGRPIPFSAPQRIVSIVAVPRLRACSPHSLTQRRARHRASERESDSGRKRERTKEERLARETRRGRAEEDSSTARSSAISARHTRMHLHPTCRCVHTSIPVSTNTCHPRPSLSRALRALQ